MHRLGKLFNNFDVNFDYDKKSNSKNNVQNSDIKLFSITNENSNPMEFLSFISSNSNRRNFPNGHSHFEYKGAKFDIFKRGNSYQSQFVRPKGFNDKEFIEKFPELEPLKNANLKQSSSLNETIKDINGMIDKNVIQGATGDCWLLSSVYSLSENEQGKEIIKESITVNNDSSVTITFKGIGVSYTLSADEINKYDTDNNISDNYSNGDNDMLALELATEKLWEDIRSGKVELKTDNEDILYAGEKYGTGINDGGLPSQMIYYLTGIESKEYYNNNLEPLKNDVVYEILQNALESGNTVLNIGVYYDTHNATLTDGSRYSLDLDNGGHAMAVTEISEDTVKFVNPWDGNKEYEVSWEEFANLEIGYISSTDLNETTYASEIIDMSEKTEEKTEETEEIIKEEELKEEEKDHIKDDYSKYNYDFLKPNHKEFNYNFEPNFNDLNLDNNIPQMFKTMFNTFFSFVKSFFSFFKI